MYVDLARSQDAVSEHVDGVTRRNALTLLAMMLVITALVNFVAMHPVKKVSDEVFRLLQVAGDDAPVGVGPDEISRLQGAVALLQKSLEELRARGEMVERIRKRDGDD